MSAIGPEEAKVLVGLNARPARLLRWEGMDSQARHCFIGLFNGAWQVGMLFKAHELTIGKAECEWGWPGDWEKLAALGLITFDIEQRPNHPDIGGRTAHLIWHVTDKGWEVREDDLAYSRELMAAREADLVSPNAKP